MAKLLLITEKQIRTKNSVQVNQIGDILAIIEDNESFSKNEIDNFKVVTLPGTVAEVEAELKKKMPEVPEEATKEEKDDPYEQVKYKFKVSDDKAITVADAADCNIVVKQSILDARSK